VASPADLTPGAVVHVTDYAPERNRIECRAGLVLAVGAPRSEGRVLVRVFGEAKRAERPGEADREAWAAWGRPHRLGAIPLVDHPFAGTGEACAACGLDPERHAAMIPVYSTAWHWPARSCADRTSVLLTPDNGPERMGLDRPTAAGPGGLDG
jgi:hypothetical protein